MEVRTRQEPIKTPKPVQPPEQKTKPAKEAGRSVFAWIPHVTPLRIVSVAGGACVFMLSVLMASYVIENYSVDVKLTASALVLLSVIIGLLCAGAIARDLFFWRKPTRSLAKLMSEIRAGEAATSELDQVAGGVRILVEPLRAIVLDFKEQKRHVHALEEEMRQRILSRTDKLERQLGAMKAQSTRDALTNLHNRRSFDEITPATFQACKQSSEDLCILMIDVDSFKLLNDTLGHAAGDELLKSIGEIIRSSVREHDTGFRLGGDEFVILLPRASRAIGDKLAQRLASLVDHLARPLKLTHQPALSIGSASLSEKSFESHKELLELADHRLYEAKQAKPHRHRRGAA